MSAAKRRLNQYSAAVSETRARSASPSDASRWRSDSDSVRAFASRSEITITCTPPPLNAVPVHPTKVGRLLDADPGMQPVVAKARELASISRLCLDFLPA